MQSKRLEGWMQAPDSSPSFETRAKSALLIYFTDHYKDYPMVLIRLSKAKRATVEPLLRRQWRALASKKVIGAAES